MPIAKSWLYKDNALLVSESDPPVVVESMDDLWRRCNEVGLTTQFMPKNGITLPGYINEYNFTVILIFTMDSAPEVFTVVYHHTNSTAGDSSSLSTPVVYAIVTGSMFCAVVILGLVNATIKYKTCKRPVDAEVGGEPTERWVSPKAQGGDAPKRHKAAAPGVKRSIRRMKLAPTTRK